jgi:hypothetical protein
MGEVGLAGDVADECLCLFIGIGIVDDVKDNGDYFLCLFENMTVIVVIIEQLFEVAVVYSVVFSIHSSVLNNILKTL